MKKRLHLMRIDITRIIIVVGIVLVAGITVFLQYKFGARAANSNDLTQYTCPQSSSHSGYGTDAADGTHTCSSSSIVSLSGKLTIAAQGNFYKQVEETRDGDFWYHTVQGFAVTDDSFVIVQTPVGGYEETDITRALRHVIAYRMSNGTEKWHTAAFPENASADISNTPEYNHFYKSKDPENSLVIGHGNDATFDSYNNRVVITNGWANRPTLNADTGERYDNVVYNGDLNGYATGISHCASCGNNGGKMIEMLRPGKYDSSLPNDNNQYYRKRTGIGSGSTLSSIATYYNGGSANNQIPTYITGYAGIGSNKKYVFQVANALCYKSGRGSECYKRFGELSGMIYQLDINTGNFVKAYYLPVNTGEIQTMEFGPDGNLYIVADWSSRSSYTDTDWQSRDWDKWRIYKVSDPDILSSMGVTKYSISYNANGGNNAPSTQTVPDYRYVKLSTAKPTKESATFKHWKDTSGSATYNPGDRVLLSSNLTLQAVWEDEQPTTITVSYDKNGGDTAPASHNISVSGGNLTSDLPTYTDHTFVHWNTRADDSGTSYSPGQKVNFTSDTKLYAIWAAVPTTVRITYYANGGQNAPASHTISASGGNLTSDVPTRSNHAFVHWNTNSGDTGTSYSPGQKVNFASDTKLYAIWHENTIAITFDANKGSGAPNIQQFGVETGGTIPATIPTRDKHDFLGWSTDKNAAEGPYQPGQSNVVFSAPTTLYAIWREQTIDITFEANKGSGAPGKQTIGKATGGNLTTAKPTRANHTFAHWNTSADDSGTSYNPGQKVTFSSNTTLYAIWNENTIQVSYNANDGVGAPAAHSIGVVNGGNLSTTVPTYNGYDFVHWNTKADNTGTSYNPGQKVTFSSNTTLYAIWNEKTITVSFDANEGMNAPASQTIGVVKGGNLTTAKPTRDNYVFVHWNTKADDSGTSYNPGQKVIFTDTTKLYAIWSLHARTITFDANGGTSSIALITKPYDEDINYSDITASRDGYSFVGWLTAISAPALINKSADSIYSSNEDITLHAAWMKTEHITTVINGESTTRDVEIVEGITDEIIRRQSSGEQLTEDELRVIDNYDDCFITIADLDRPTREGYTFLGWSTTEGATTPEFPADSTRLVEPETALYAVWREGSEESGDDGGNTPETPETPETPHSADKNPRTVDQIITIASIFAATAGAGTALFVIIKKRR